MSVTGEASGAGTVVNAFATGRGVAFGLGWSVQARVRPHGRTVVYHGRRRLPPDEARLVVETVASVQRRIQREQTLRVDVRSDIPPRRGLKSSSAVGVAVARATLAHADVAWTDREVLRAVVEAALASGTSLTGALDDAAACLHGGLVFCDNDRRRLLRRASLPKGLVALVRVPRRQVATGSLDRSAFRGLAPQVRRAWRAAWDGRVPEAMAINTAAYAPLLGVEADFSRRAREAGAWAAGLSGKGPAEIALVRTRDAARLRRALAPVRTVPVREAS